MKYLNTEKKKLVEFYMILFSLAVIWMINMEDLAQEYVLGNKNIQLQNFWKHIIKHMFWRNMKAAICK